MSKYSCLPNFSNCPSTKTVLGQYCKYWAYLDSVGNTSLK